MQATEGVQRDWKAMIEIDFNSGILSMHPVTWVLIVINWVTQVLTLHAHLNDCHLQDQDTKGSK